MHNSIRQSSRRGALLAAGCAVLVAAGLFHFPACAAVTVVDGAGRKVTLAQPARRIVSLAPHVTELLFAAGAGGRVVGTVRFSDYPPPARAIPRIGDASRIDMERVLTLRPDLVAAWHSSLPAPTLKRLTALGLTVYISEPRALRTIAADIRSLGRLAGTGAVAREAAAQFSERLRGLRQHYGGQAPVTVFFQTWDRPLMTVNGRHFISRVLRLCGGRNVFASLGPLSAAVSAEAVLAADPQAIMAGVAGGEQHDVLAPWRHWSALAAVRLDNLFTLPDDLINRPGPRILQGADLLCRDLAAARRRIDMSVMPVRHTPSE